MKDAVLIELVAKLRRSAKEPEATCVSPESSTMNARDEGWRLGVRASADALEKLIDVLGDES